MTLRHLLLTACAAAILAAGPQGAVAHSEIRATTPADGAVLEAPPDVISLSFDTPVRVTMIRLADAAGAEIEVTRVGGTDPATRVDADPAALGPGNYTVEWRGLSDDGHPVQGRFSFRIAD